jgi:hypothetical protein
MPSFHDHMDGYAECAVCRSDTQLLCSPCGDPVCHNCACPNGCEAVSAGVMDGWDRSRRELAPNVQRQAA